MRDQPDPTDDEQDRTPDELPEHQAMQYPGHEDPELPGDPPARATDE